MSGKISAGSSTCIAPHLAARRRRAIGFSTEQPSDPSEQPLGLRPSSGLGFKPLEQSAIALTTKFSPADRLAILQDADRSRTWHTLDDERVCVRCTKVFNGYDVQLVPRRDGQFEIHCPTDGCDSIPVHWFFHGSGLGRSGNSAPHYAEADLNGW
jgi:hypothetical protein